MRVNRWLTMLSVSLFTFPVHAMDWDANVTIEHRQFFNDALDTRQGNKQTAGVLQAEVYHDFNPQTRWVFAPYYRHDSLDANRSQGDIRELSLNWVGDWVEIYAGIGKVFWGVTESAHLVDIINQTDNLASVDGEQKLGQAMIKLAFARDWGNLDAYVLPYFREREFASPAGRLRAPFALESDAAYQHEDEEKHWDYALRYQHSIDDWELGASWFKGTSREPQLQLTPSFSLQPFYDQIEQFGIDLQWINDAWLWKLEAIKRNQQREDNYYAAIGGLEYTWYGLFGDADLGIVAEYLYDQRDSAPLDKDVMLGLRWVQNDIAGSEALFGVLQDSEGKGRSLRLESSRRFGSQWKVNLEAQLFQDYKDTDPLFLIQQDDFIQLGVTRYF